MEKVSIIIPAYNEEKRIGSTLEEYGRFFQRLKGGRKLDFEILIVINNTKDKTEEIVKEKQKRFKEIRYINFKEGGKGFAITEGFKDALTRDSNIIGFVDADMATRPEAYYDLIKNIGNYGGVIASRYVEGSMVNPKQTTKRIIVSRIFNCLIRSILLIPYRDTQCGAKLFKRTVIEKTIPNLKMSKWAFDVDLLFSIRKKGFKIKEHKTIWGDRGDSKINFIRSGSVMALGVIRLRLLNSYLSGIVSIYDKVVKKIIWRIFK